MDLKELKTEELNKLLMEIKEELESRKVPECIYTHDCFGSAKYHFESRKHWAKIIINVDKTKSNGMAFQGNFLNVREENLVPKDSIIVEVCDTKVKAYKITGDREKELIAECYTKAMIDLIRTVAETVN